MVKNEHTIRQMERMLEGNGAGIKRSAIDPGQGGNASSNTYSFENVLES